MTKFFHVYTDESGDEGKNSGRWFINTALIVQDENHEEVKNYERELKNSLWEDRGMDAPPMLHWNKLTNHTVRRKISRHLGKKPYVSISICIDKTSLIGMDDRDIFFHFTCQLLVERVSWYVDDLGGRFNMTFSKRGGLTTATIQAAVTTAMNERKSEIRPVFDLEQLSVQPMEKYILLRAVDNNASALGNALNKDKYGELTPEYFSNMSSRMYRYKERNRVWKYGLKVFPSAEGKDGYDGFIADYPHAENWFK